MATDVAAATGSSLTADRSVWELIMEWGPTIVQLSLIALLVYHTWQRNVLKTIACTVAVVVTFILGW